jgi:hypothetical protein
MMGTIPLGIEARRDLKIEKIALCLKFSSKLNVP